MAWSFTDLKYGWKIATGITLAAVTIYVAGNTRERVNQEDIIELVLGTTERCLATQYSTNPVSYYVAPPSFVRSWYSNSYETTNVPGDLVTNWTAVCHTNVFTNAIGWRTDRAMMAELDEKIKALVPYYCDLDTVYEGSTNIVMLTVTGLWASLGIGDGVSQFTRVPSSGTNAATYGAYPWRIYKMDLEERYKVLYALKCIRHSSAFDEEYAYHETSSEGDDFGPLRTWENSQEFLDYAISIPFPDRYVLYCFHTLTNLSDYDESSVGYVHGYALQELHEQWRGYDGAYKSRIYVESHQRGGWRRGNCTARMKITGPRLFCGTNLNVIKSYCEQYILEAPVPNFYLSYSENDFWGDTPHGKQSVFQSYCSGDEVFTNALEKTLKEWSSDHVFLIDYPSPVSADLSGVSTNLSHIIGASYNFVSPMSYIFPDFQYCTNHFWE